MAISDTLAGFKLTLFVNHSCNLQCRYCYTGRKFDKPMGWEVARSAIEFGFSEAGERFLLLAFFGGEPLLEPQLIERAVAYAQSRSQELGRRTFFSVATNGTLLDEARVALLAKHRFQVQVSLDGDAAAHDANRRFRSGFPSHSQAVAGLRRLLSAGVHPHVVAVVDPANAERLPHSLDFFLSLGLRTVQFAPNLSASWTEDACERFEQALGALGDRLIAAFRAGQFLQVDPLHGKIVSHLVSGTRPPERCAFGKNELAVAPSGRVYPCDRVVREDDDPRVCLGSLESGLDTDKRQALAGAKDRPDEECKGCELRQRCSHWCGCANYQSTGDPSRPSPLQCWFERSFITAADRVGGILFAEKNPVFLARYYRSVLQPAP